MTDTLKAAIAAIDRRFQSGNSVPIDKATVSAAEWAELRAAADALAAQPAAESPSAEQFIEAPDVPAEDTGLNTYYSRDVVLACIQAAIDAAQPARAGGDALAVDDGDIEKGRAHARYILELLKRTDWGQHSAAGASSEWEEATCCESVQLLARAALAAAPAPVRAGGDAGWHAPGLGEVHNADHTAMIYCEDGDGVVNDELAQRVVAALAAAPQPAAAEPAPSRGKEWGMRLLAAAKREAVDRGARKAYDDHYHKVRADIGYDDWLMVWKKAIAWWSEPVHLGSAQVEQPAASTVPSIDSIIEMVHWQLFRMWRKCGQPKATPEELAQNQKDDAALRTALQQLADSGPTAAAATVSATSKCVPVEPTDVMLADALDAVSSLSDREKARPSFMLRPIWAAMLNAAPAAPAAVESEAPSKPRISDAAIRDWMDRHDLGPVTGDNIVIGRDIAEDAASLHLIDGIGSSKEGGAA